MKVIYRLSCRFDFLFDQVRSFSLLAISLQMICRLVIIAHVWERVLV
jgi:hypothetical protein